MVPFKHSAGHAQYAGQRFIISLLCALGTYNESTLHGYFENRSLTASQVAFLQAHTIFILGVLVYEAVEQDRRKRKGMALAYRR